MHVQGAFRHQPYERAGCIHLHLLQYVRECCIHIYTSNSVGVQVVSIYTSNIVWTCTGIPFHCPEYKVRICICAWNIRIISTERALVWLFGPEEAKWRKKEEFLWHFVWQRELWQRLMTDFALLDWALFFQMWSVNTFLPITVVEHLPYSFHYRSLKSESSNNLYRHFLTAC